MDGPVYKLEHVVHSGEGMEDFEGPLDLILYLLGKNKIEIQDIPIALILEQYLAYLERRQQMDLEVASEFITMAAQLMFIKSRMLLSIEDEEAQSEMEELIRSLEERRSGENYARIKCVTEILGPMGEFGRDVLVKAPEPMETGRVYEYSHRPKDLLKAMREVAERGERRMPPPVSSFSDIVRQEPYPVAGKAREVLDRLYRGITSFRLLFWGSRSRSEVVATFLAVLELCRARIVTLTGGERDCTVTPTGESTDALQL
mgnify:FL=1